MRITGGEYCGRTVKVAKGKLEIRPSMDRMRQSVFNILGNLEGYSFLDLFTGTGIIALEASSRGAQPVVCVEKDPAKRPMLIENIGIARERIECHIQPVELFVKRCKDVFDIVFCDPPFPYRFRKDLVASIMGGAVLKPGGLLLIHRPSEDPMPQSIGSAILEDRRDYGRSIVDFYRKGPAAPLEEKEAGLENKEEGENPPALSD